LGDFLLWAIFYFGRFFTLGDFLLWAIFYFERFFHSGSFFITGVAQNFRATYFFIGVSCASILTINWLGYILGDFFSTSPSGHPARPL
jgi:hypothetical protein